MLTSLKIEHFALVDQLTLQFQPGMTVFTGETGAGKSILLDALMLVLGARSDASLIRHDENKCTITATFQIDAESIAATWLTHEEIPYEVKDDIILKRILYREGRSKSFINGELTPLHKIKAFTALLAHFHGQHEHYALQGHTAHRKELDRFSKHGALQANVAKHFHQMERYKAELIELEKQALQEDKLSLLTYQLKELEALAPTETEMTTLHLEQKTLQNAKDYRETAYAAESTIEGDDTPSILMLLAHVKQLCHRLPGTHPTIQNACTAIDTALIQCKEALFEIRHFSDTIEINPKRLLEVEERLSTLFQVARKFHVEPHGLATLYQTLQKKLVGMTEKKAQKNVLETAYKTEKERYDKAAAALSESRLHHAHELSFKVTKIIQTLGMPKGTVTFTVSPHCIPTVHGFDQIDCVIQTNPGMPAQSIGKIASGGELSRISLAIQMVTATHALTPTLLFDEVDVGIGGHTAAQVGKLLQTLGRRLQVFCVTHQPQVASAALHHFRVDKLVENDKTFTKIVALSESEKITELSRMLGGLTITEETRQHAKTLRETAKT